MDQPSQPSFSNLDFRSDTPERREEWLGIATSMLQQAMSLHDISADVSLDSEIFFDPAYSLKPLKRRLTITVEGWVEK